MPADLSIYKVNKGDGNNSAPFDSFVQAVEDLFNAIGDNTKNSFSPFPYIDPAQLMQGAAASGDWLAWNGTDWAKATPAAGVAQVIGDQLLNAQAASVQFLSIPGTFKHLFLHMHMRCARTGLGDIRINFNNDTAANYDDYHIEATGTTPTFANNEHLANGRIVWNNQVAYSTLAPELFSDAIVWIPHYAGAANNKMAIARCFLKTGTATGNLELAHAMGSWRSNAAITRIDVAEDNATNYLVGSRFTLYGI